MEFVQTKGALLKRGAAEALEVVTYESHKPKKKLTPLQQALGPPQPLGMKDTRKGIDIKRARREVIKFGITGFSSEKQQEAKVAQAIALGARPPKNVYKNYKELMKEKQQQKLLQKKTEAFQQLGKNAVGASTARSKKFVFNKALGKPGNTTKSKGDILQIYGKATLDTSKLPSANKSKKLHKRKR